MRPPSRRRGWSHGWFPVWPGIAVLAFALQRLSSRFPGPVERIYSHGVFRLLARIQSLIFGWVPFSVAELMVWLGAPALLVWMALAVRSVWKAPRREKWSAAGRRAIALVVFLSVAYAGFILLWGLNYSRQPFAQSAGLQVAPASKEELAALCRSLIDRANTARAKVHEDANGVAVLNHGIADALRRAQLGYDRAAPLYPFLAGRYGRPKAVLTSGLWSYTGVSGMYWPYTGEANINTAAPAFTIPASAAHEMAHQHGFAREDEANYIAYLTCRLHPDADFRYSGVVLALTSALNAYRAVDPEGYPALTAAIGPAVKRDLKSEADFWKRHQGPVSDYSDKVNDRYLKANGQREGTLSYGRMVDLLLAEFRAGGGK